MRDVGVGTLIASSGIALNENSESDDEENPKTRGKNNRPIDEPVDLEEDLAGQEITGGFLETPGETEYGGTLGDPRYDPKTGTHNKRRGNHKHPDGTKTEVHADQDRLTGELSDVKYKDAPDNEKSRGSKEN